MKRLLSASILAASLTSGAALAQVGPYVGASVGQSTRPCGAVMLRLPFTHAR